MSVLPGHFSLLWYQRVEELLFVVGCYYVLDFAFCTQQLLSDLFLIVTVGTLFYSFYRRENKGSERLGICPRVIQWGWDSVSESRHV